MHALSRVQRRKQPKGAAPLAGPRTVLHTQFFWLASFPCLCFFISLSSALPLPARPLSFYAQRLHARSCPPFALSLPVSVPLCPPSSVSPPLSLLCCRATCGTVRVFLGAAASPVRTNRFPPPPFPFPLAWQATAEAQARARTLAARSRQHNPRPPHHHNTTTQQHNNTTTQQHNNTPIIPIRVLYVPAPPLQTRFLRLGLLLLYCICSFPFLWPSGGRPYTSLRLLVSSPRRGPSSRLGFPMLAV